MPSAGSVGVSRAMTITPASRAFLMAGTMALVSLGVIRIPLTPALTMFSMIVTWVSLSPSKAPAPVNKVAPFVSSRLRAFFHLDEEGLVSVLVIRPIDFFSRRDRSRFWFVSPAIAQSESGILAIDARLGFVGDQGHAGIGITGNLLAGLGDSPRWLQRPSRPS